MALVAAGRDDALVDHMTSLRDFALRPWCDPAAAHGSVAATPTPAPHPPGTPAPVPFATLPTLPVPRPDGQHWWPTGQWTMPSTSPAVSPAGGGGGSMPPLSSPHPWPSCVTDADDVRTSAAAVGLTLADGVVAYRIGDYDGAVDRLLAVRGALHMVGATHTDRDVFVQTLNAAATQADQLPLARALLSERVSSVRTNAPNTWYHYAGVLAAMGLEEEAVAARDQAYVLGLGQHGAGTH